MTMPQNVPLREVLDAYAVAGPTLERLKTWVKAYPPYHDALTTLTVDWLVSSWEDELQEEPSDDETAVAQALRVLGRRLTPAADRAAEGPVSEGPEASLPPLGTLREELHRGDRALPDVLARAHLSLDLFAMLNAGLLTFPDEEARERVAVLLATAAGVAAARIVLRMRTQRPRLGAGASLAEGKPQVSTQSFLEAVEMDEDLSEADKLFWRSALATPMSA